MLGKNSGNSIEQALIRGLLWVESSSTRSADGHAKSSMSHITNKMLIWYSSNTGNMHARQLTRQMLKRTRQTLHRWIRNRSVILLYIIIINNGLAGGFKIIPIFNDGRVQPLTYKHKVGSFATMFCQKCCRFDPSQLLPKIPTTIDTHL